MSNLTITDDLICRKTNDDDIFERSVIYNDQYYGEIIIKYIKKHLFLKNNDQINNDLTKICEDIENDISQLKYCIIKLETILFHMNHYSCELVNKTWSKSLSLTSNHYHQIKNNDYKELFKFFLLMIHNSPYFLPNDDNVIPGCNRIFDLDKKIIKNKKPLSKYYEHKLNQKCAFNYMRIPHWLNMCNHKKFNCYCEYFF